MFIGIPVRNAEGWLPNSIKQLESLDYPKDKIRIVYSYSESSDKTLDMLKEFAKTSKMKVEIYNEPFDLNLKKAGIQWGSVIYKDFQNLIEEDYFMLYDSDIIKIPTDLIQRLIEVDADIIAPYPWSENKRHFYDNFIFRVNNIRFSPSNPPAMNDLKPVCVDSVGTCFLAKAEVFKSVKIEDPYPNLTFCNNARKLGFSVVALPYVEVFHADLELMGICHMPLDQSYGGYPNNGFLTNAVKLQEFYPKAFRKQIFNKQEQDFIKQFKECKE